MLLVWMWFLQKIGSKKESCLRWREMAAAERGGGGIKRVQNPEGIIQVDSWPLAMEFGEGEEENAFF